MVCLSCNFKLSRELGETLLKRKSVSPEYLDAEIIELPEEESRSEDIQIQGMCKLTYVCNIDFCPLLD